MTERMKGEVLQLEDRRNGSTAAPSGLAEAGAYFARLLRTSGRIRLEIATRPTESEVAPRGVRRVRFNRD